jgi:two-component system OmpR family response regulator
LFGTHGGLHYFVTNLQCSRHKLVSLCIVMTPDASRKPLVLIAEDDHDLGRLLVFSLQRRGYRTRLATDGRAALNAAFEHKPDLILLDLMLPILHGYEVCRLLKSGPVLARIPVIMLTALVTTENKVRGFKLGADDYLTKPFAMPELLARINALLSRRKRRNAPVEFADL